MTVEIALVFGIVAAALALFASQKLPLDVTALLILVTVMAIPQVFHSAWLVERGVDLRAAFPTVAEGLSGLSNPATVTVLAMFILSAGIQRTGLVHLVGRRVFGLVGSSELRQMLVIAMIVGPVSGFVNNTAAVAVMIPLVVDMAKRSGTPVARLLLPLSFLGMMGGTLTLIGTSTNILASSLLVGVEEFGRPIGMFEFTHLGAVVLGVGVVYFLTIGRWLLPEGTGSEIETGKEESFVVEVEVGDGSPLCGTTLQDAGVGKRFGVEVVRLVRGGRSWVREAGTTELAAGDLVQLRGEVGAVVQLLHSEGLELVSEFGSRNRVRTDGRIVRVLLRGRRSFTGQTGSSIDFWARFRARPVGLGVDQPSGRRLRDEPLHVGEMMLFELSATALGRLRRSPDVVVLDEHNEELDFGRMWLAAGIVVGVVLAAALTPLDIVVTALAGVVLMVATGCVGTDDVYSGVSWDVIILLAGVIPLGIAMTKSGAAAWIADHFATVASGWHPLVVLMVLYAVTTVLTELVSNNASVVILVPVTVSLSATLELALFPLVLAVMFAASTSFLSPVGYQTNTMVFGTGVYRFTDFARVGALLNLLLMGVTTLLLWRWWMV